MRVHPKIDKASACEGDVRVKVHEQALRVRMCK
jgi:hypothetical protein